MTNSENLEQIERYLRHEMSEEERSNFEQSLETDASLREAFAFHQELHSRLGDTKRAEVEKTALEAQANYLAAQKKKTITRYLFPAVAAVAAMLILFFVLYTPAPDHDYQTIAMNYADPYPAPTFRSEASKETTLFEEAMAEYRARKYDKTVIALKQLSKSDPEYTQAQFYIGISLVLSAEYKQATEVLDEYLTEEKAENTDVALWYKALALLGLENTEEAMQILHTLSLQGKGRVKTQAEQLLKELN